MDDGEPYLDDTEHSALHIKDMNNEICSTIKYLLPTQASKYLGHLKEGAATKISQELSLKEVIKLKQSLWLEVKWILY